MMSGLDENDPKSMGRWMRKMAAESGEAMPAEFDEVVGRLESGEDPENIENPCRNWLRGWGEHQTRGEMTFDC